jgi:copper chaperone CopZ
MKQSETLKIDGMHCDACVRRVRAALSGVSGVDIKDVKVGSAEIEVEPGTADVEGAVNAINDIGFSAQVDKR